ncbi:hypothetical protein Acr_03g0013670 [Actinidia rufa]|uniref:Uncharacterized protein n=1 Tax=Actinidia rufa TaxID=165716 RepID=A0A7J0EDP7_9ERIC|nr:hypothetical protein Acr_03g0013670 [Actinidia rufa]
MGTSGMPFPGRGRTAPRSKPTVDCLNITRSRSVVAISSFWGIRRWASNNILPQVTPFYVISYLLFQLKTILRVVPVVLAEFTVFVPVPLLGIPSWVGNLNLKEIQALNTLSVNGGSVRLVKVSTVTGAFVPVLMALSRASRSLIFCDVDLSLTPIRLPLQGLLPRPVCSLPAAGLALDSKEEALSRRGGLGDRCLPLRARSAFQVRSLAGIGHGRSSVIRRAAGTWSGRVEIRVRIFRRDFQVTQFRKCIPVIPERSQEDAMWRAVRLHRDRDVIVIGRDLRR